MPFVAASEPRYYLATLYAETFVYGMYTVLFALTMHRLLSKWDILLKRLPLLIAAVVMYCIGTVHSAVFLHEAISSLIFVNGLGMYDNPLSSTYEYTKVALVVANCLIGDAVVIWRAWRLGHTVGKIRHFLCAIPLILLIATGATGTGMVISCAGFDESSDWANSSPRKWTIAWAILTIATNFVVTVIIVFEARKRERELNRVDGALTNAMEICIESGLLYCCTFVIFLILFLFGSHGAYIMSHMICQLAGVYPTILIVVVSIRSSASSVSLDIRERTLSTRGSLTPLGGPLTETKGRRDHRRAQSKLWRGTRDNFDDTRGLGVHIRVDRIDDACDSKPSDDSFPRRLIDDPKAVEDGTLIRSQSPEYDWTCPKTSSSLFPHSCECVSDVSTKV